MHNKIHVTRYLRGGKLSKRVPTRVYGLTFSIENDEDLSAGLQLLVLLLSYDGVLQVLALGPAQCLGIVHIQQPPNLSWVLCDAHGSIAGLDVSGHVLIRHF